MTVGTRIDFLAHMGKIGDESLGVRGRERLATSFQRRLKITEDTRTQRSASRTLLTYNV
jgi:hypothetical protein